MCPRISDNISLSYKDVGLKTVLIKTLWIPAFAQPLKSPWPL